jgi:hypothetical protein
MQSISVRGARRFTTRLKLTIGFLPDRFGRTQTYPGSVSVYLLKAPKGLLRFAANAI